MIFAYHEGSESVFQSNDAAHPQHEQGLRNVIESFSF